MSEKAKLALSMLSAAILLGLLGDFLLRSGPPGVNFGIWVGALAAAVAGTVRWHGVSMTGGGRWLVLPAVGFALAFAWRDSPTLALANITALLACTVLAASYSRMGRIVTASAGDYALAAVKTGLNILSALFLLWTQDSELKAVPRGRWARRAAPVGRGLAIASPLLLVFGVLFASADAAFNSIVSGLFNWDLDEALWHLFWVIFWAAIAGGLMRKALLGSAGDKLPLERPGWFSLGIVETATALGALDALFLAFVLVQFRYFFGGAALVEASVNLSYSDYARRGFFELVAVAAFVLPVLLAADWLLRRERPSDERLFRILAAALIAMVVVIMFSALQRMRLYQEEFGQTELRLYTTAFMGWLALLFAWFLATVLRGRRDLFAFGAVAAGLIVTVALNALNPDSYIVATNLDRARAGKPFDAAYVASLSAGAAPEIVGALPSLPEHDRRLLAKSLLDRWSRPPATDFRTWNWDRELAYQAVSAEKAMLQAGEETKQDEQDGQDRSVAIRFYPGRW